MKLAEISLARVAGRPADFPRDGRPEVCFLGRSNVGKSSLLNKLLRRPGLARVSKTPGRTQTINFFLVDDRSYFVDLPGFGYARAPAALRRGWNALMAAYFDRPTPPALAIQLVDIRHDPTDLDQQLTTMLIERGIPLALALTKSDKVSGNHITRMRTLAPRALGLPRETPVVVTSAQTGAGMRDLFQLAASAVESGRRGATEGSR